MRWTWCKVCRYIVTFCICIRMRVFHPWFLSSKTIHSHPLFVSQNKIYKFQVNNVKLNVQGFGFYFWKNFLKYDCTKTHPSDLRPPQSVSVYLAVSLSWVQGPALSMAHHPACHHPSLCTELYLSFVTLVVYLCFNVQIVHFTFSERIINKVLFPRSLTFLTSSQWVFMRRAAPMLAGAGLLYTWHHHWPGPHWAVDTWHCCSWSEPVHQLRHCQVTIISTSVKCWL